MTRLHTLKEISYKCTSFAQKRRLFILLKRLGTKEALVPPRYKQWVMLGAGAEATYNKTEGLQKKNVLALVKHNITIIETAAHQLQKQLHVETKVNRVNRFYSLNYCRALILCFPDRYGYGAFKVPSKYPKYIVKAMDICKKYHKEVRKILGQRKDTERCQIQRPLLGASLLTIVGPRNTKFSKGLNAILVLGCHPQKGVKQFRMTESQWQSCPFKLPNSLQPKQPKRGSAQEVVLATAINSFLSNVFASIHRRDRRGSDADAFKIPYRFPDARNVVQPDEPPS